MSCANPDCPNDGAPFWRRRNSYVQVIERDSPASEVTAPSRVYFASVTCSKRCAIVVMTPLADAEDKAREDKEAEERREREEAEAARAAARPNYVVLDTP